MSYFERRHNQSAQGEFPKCPSERGQSREARSFLDRHGCSLNIDDHYAAAFRFRDAPRAESRSFVKHLAPKHHFQRVMIVSGDRESEVSYLAEQVGITEIHA